MLYQLSYTPSAFVEASIANPRPSGKQKIVHRSVKPQAMQAFALKPGISAIFCPLVQPDVSYPADETGV